MIQIKRQALFAGAMTVFTASVITRLLGFAFRVYIADTIGAQGMGLYQLVTSLYMLAASFCTSGISIAVSKMAAEQLAANKYGGLRVILKTSVLWSILISSSVAVILFWFAPFIGRVVLGDERTILSLRCLAPGIPFMAVSAAVKGYYFALRNSIKPSFSIVLEQVAKMVFIVFIVRLWTSKGSEYSTAAVAMGMTIGEIIGAAYMIMTYFYGNRGGGKKGGRKKQAFVDIVSISVPIQASSSIHSALRLFENILIISSLKIFNGGDADAAIGIYGVLKGMVLPLLMFPTSLLQGGITVLIPEMAGANAIGRTKTVKTAASKTLKITLLIGIYISLIYFIFPKQIGALFYNDPSVPPLLFKLSFLCPLIYLEMVSSGILNGIGSQVSPMIYSIADSVLRLILIFVFVPKGGIDAFLWIMIFSNCLTSALNFTKLLRVSKLKPNVREWFVKPSFCAVIAAFPSVWVNNALSGFAPKYISLPVSCIVSAALYLVLLLAFGSVKRKDIDYFKDCVKLKSKT